MARRYLLDTTALSQLIRQPQGAVAQRLRTAGEANICTSVIVACELRCGARQKHAPQLTRRVEALLASIEVLALDNPADRVYAQIRDALERSGSPSGGNELLIATHALAQGCVLVTDKEREFSRVPDLIVENWS
jgi:tRNA(fMet)-specific endonuclease VapC